MSRKSVHRTRELMIGVVSVFQLLLVSSTVQTSRMQSGTNYP